MQLYELQEDDLTVSGFSMQPHPSGKWVHFLEHEKLIREAKKKAYKDALDWVHDNGWVDTYYAMPDKDIEKEAELYASQGV